MSWFQKLSARTLSHVVAAVSVLHCLFVASCCCANGNTECHDTRKAYCFNASFGSRGRVTSTCISNAYPQCLGDAQNSTEYGCDSACCCGDGSRGCKGGPSGIACNCRKKPTGPTRLWHSGASLGQSFPPTSRIVGAVSWAPTLTSAAARCSLLCRFLL